jgi:hypothetical protein
MLVQPTHHSGGSKVYLGVGGCAARCIATMAFHHSSGSKVHVGAGPAELESMYVITQISSSAWFFFYMHQQANTFRLISVFRMSASFSSRFRSPPYMHVVLSFAFCC